MTNKLFSDPDLEYLDEDGYPTDEVLKAIEEYDLAVTGSKGYDEAEKLTEFVKALWCYPDFFRKRKDGLWEASTGGWSGNEALISALKANPLYGALYFCRQDVGGHFILGRLDDWFEFREKEREREQREA